MPRSLVRSRLAPFFVAVVVLGFASPAEAEQLDSLRHALTSESAPTLLVGLVLGIVVTGFLVGRFAPARRRHLLRPGMYYALYVLALAIGVGAEMGGTRDVASTSFSISRLFVNLTLVELVSITVFFVALPRMRLSIPNIARDLMVGVAYAVASMAFLHGIGVQLTSLLAASGVITLVASLSLQSTLGNVVGGVALQFDGSISEGDWIRLPDKSEGRVRQIRWRHTVIETRNWDTLIVPNGQLLNDNILVLGKREDEPVQHRMWVYFQVDYRFAPERVVDAVSKALEAPMEGVARTPAPNCICYDLAAEGRMGVAYYAVRYWLTDLARDDPTSSMVRTRVYAALARAGIQLAVQPFQVSMTASDGEPHRLRTEEETTRRAEQLGRIALFRTLTTEERFRIAAKLHYAPFCTGEIVTRQGAEAHYLYILAAGTADIRVRRGEDTAEAHVASVVAPTIFGEMGLLTGAPRTATVVATSPVECFRLDKTDLQEIIQARPEVAEGMAQVLAERKLELDAVRERQGDRVSIAEEHHRILGAVKRFFGMADGSG